MIYPNNEYDGIQVIVLLAFCYILLTSFSTMHKQAESATIDLEVTSMSYGL